MRYEIGKTYRVPHVRARWVIGERIRWLPVIAPMHQDAEIIQYPHDHWHVDYRFVSEAVAWRAAEYWITAGYASPLYNAVFAQPLMASRVVPTDYGWPIGEAWRLKDHPVETWSQVKRVKCRRRYPPYPSPPWAYELEQAYCFDTLRAGVCPHRGADLSTMTPDDQGVVTCPLHGLKWNLETGLMVRTIGPRPVHDSDEDDEDLESDETLAIL